MSGLDFSRFTPHGFCLAWQPGLIWLEAASDIMIAAAYFSIPAALLVFVRRRRDLAFKPVFGLFAAFILACGATHVFGALTLWVPAYWADAGVKAVTALLSVATAVMLWPLLPKALALPSPVALRLANEALAQEVDRGLQTAALLRDSETRQRLLYARTPAALHALNSEGIILEVSDRWLEMVGHAREAVIGRPITDFYEPESAAASRAHLAAFHAGEGPREAERRVVRSDGRVRDVEMAIDVERDTGGRLQRVLVAVTDVTARKAAEAALRATEERLRQAQKMEAVGQLTGGIAHDFNNLLTTILGSLELLQQRPGLDARAVRLASNALDGARRAARLTSQLLTFSRRQLLAPEPLYPPDIVAGIHDLLDRSLGKRGGIKVSHATSQWPVLADQSQLEAALLNLVINARDAIGPDGTVAIAMDNRSLDQAGIAALGLESGGPEPLPAGDYVSIAVIDDGCGMSEAVRSRAFEPFFTTKPPGTGTGLGLPQIYGFVSQSGGAVRILSAPGAGTSVEMFLPRAAERPVQGLPDEPHSGPVPHGQGRHVLVVEDDSALRQTMVEALRDQGFRVSAAGDGEEGLRLLQDASRGADVALLFTDLTMPGSMNGVALARAARAWRPDLPVLLATGYGDPAVLQDWPESADILNKPYSPDSLARRIALKLRLQAAV